jgi:hypothetical protein
MVWIADRRSRSVHCGRGHGRGCTLLECSHSPHGRISSTIVPCTRMPTVDSGPGPSLVCEPASMADCEMN